jgi:SAM-dependent methyltransferase
MGRIGPRVKAALDPLSKSAFLLSLPARAKLLDVGCGNHGPPRAKAARPDIRYTGIDIQAYRLSALDRALAERLVIAEPEAFAKAVAAMGSDFDAVISSHNLEHCDAPLDVLCALAAALKPGGRLYLSFPSLESASFPSRAGTLNFYDDKTHKHLFALADLEARLGACGLRRRRATLRNRGRWNIPRLLGGASEPLSALTGRVLRFTWYYWGFETVWIGERIVER